MSINHQQRARVRQYSSPARARLKEQNRADVLAAAAVELSSAGFAATTMESIAQRAGVSIGTVQTLGTKAAVLRRVYSQAVEIDPAIAIPTHSPLWAALDRGDRAGAVDHLADLGAGRDATAAGVWPVATAEALNDPELTATIYVTAARRQTACAHLVEALNLPNETVRQLYLTLSADTYLQLTQTLELSISDYRDWLSTSLTHSLT